MNRIASLTLITALITPLAISAGVASAQPRQSFAEDNIWAGKAHQPTQTEVTQRERSAGVALPQQQQRKTDRELESLYQSLMHNTGQPQG